MDTAYMGCIMAWGSGRIPRSWMPCDGRVLPISQYQALFALLGVQYGGNGSTTFNLPDLRGRFLRGVSSALPPGKTLGAATMTLTEAHLPAHTHVPGTITDITGEPEILVDMPGTSSAPVADGYLGTVTQSIYAQNPTGRALAQLGGFSSTPFPAATSTDGGGQPISLLPPYQAVNWIICVQGLFPSRN